MPAYGKPAGSGRILLIHTDGNSYNNPSLKALIDLLLENGFSIDLRYPKSEAPMPPVQGVNLIPYGRVLRRLKSVIFDRLCSTWLIFVAVVLERILYYRKYDLVIGVDRQGLLEANVFNQLTKTPYIYISFEITFESETSSRFKSLERKAAKNIAYWIIQDEIRAEQARRENELSEFNQVLLPLASAGSGDTSSDRLRDRLGIPGHKRVAIMIGSITAWSMSSEIVSSVPDWPDDWVLIMHERYGKTRESLSTELALFDELIGKKIFISDHASERVDDMAEILSGVDIGIAFYQPDASAGPYVGNNLKFLGLASGKISTYLRYGIPSMVNEIGLYAEEIKSHNLGIVVTSPLEIGERLRIYNRSASAKPITDYFSRKLDFNLYSDDLLKTINQAIENKPVQHPKIQGGI